MVSFNIISYFSVALNAEFHVFLIYLFIYLITSTIWCGTHNRAGFQFKCVLTDNRPSPGEAGHTTGAYVPYSFPTVVWVLLRPTRTN